MAQNTLQQHSTLRRQGFSRDLEGARRLTARAAATRRRDLAAVLRFSARRRMSRCGGGVVRDRAIAPTFAPELRDREIAPTEGARTSRARESAPTGPRRFRDQQVGARLLTRTPISGGLLKLTLSRPAGFAYRPGQHVKVGLPGLMRTYSLVSAPHQRHLEFFVEVFPEGRLSQRLRGIDPGASMALRAQAGGDLEVDARYPNQLMVATVTGVAPYVSLLRDHLQGRTGGEARHRFVILHGASFTDELGYADELTALARRHPRSVVYLPTVSRPGSPRNAGWTGLTGRVEAQLEAVLTRHGLTPANTAAFACGQPNMVRNVAGELRRRGFTTYTEPFD